MTARTVAIYCVFGDDSWLGHSVRSIYDAVDGVLFVVSSCSWYGQEGSDVSVLNRITQLDDPLHKFEVVRGRWEKEIDQRNFSVGVALYRGFNQTLIVDADEIYETAQLIAALTHIQDKPEVDVWHVKSFTYWKNVRYRIDPLEPFDPPILMRPGKGGFVEARNYLGAKHELIVPTICMCHHLSYVRSDEALRRKHIFGSPHSQSARPEWYEKIWKAWESDTSITGLHPVHAPWYGRAIEQHPELVPSVLREEFSLAPRYPQPLKPI